MPFQQMTAELETMAESKCAGLLLQALIEFLAILLERVRHSRIGCAGKCGVSGKVCFDGDGLQLAVHHFRQLDG
jgi:hypothetical protein